MLLLKDPALPNLCRLVAGARCEGHGWRTRVLKRSLRSMMLRRDHPDVLLLKLISRKVTYVHRPLWPQIVAIGRARALWQTKDLSTLSRKLLAEVDRVPVEPGRDKAAAAKELDARMLVFIAQFHSESGAHLLRLESWDHWSNRTHFRRHSTTSALARKALEERIVNLNREVAGRGRLPWQGKLE